MVAAEQQAMPPGNWRMIVRTAAKQPTSAVCWVEVTAFADGHRPVWGGCKDDQRRPATAGPNPTLLRCESHTGGGGGGKQPTCSEQPKLYAAPA